MAARVRRFAAIVAALAASCAASLAACAVPASAYEATVSVTDSPISRPLPPGFVGVALTYPAIPKLVGTGSAPVDPVLVHLIRSLSPTGHPVLRIGGESADHSWWPVPGMRRPLGITYDIGPAWATVAHRLAQALDARLLLGVNLEADRPAIDSTEARQLLARVGSRDINSFQIGNEPDLYPAIPWYKVLNGHAVPWYSKTGTQVYARSQAYGPAQFAREVSRAIDAMPRFPVAGPESNEPAYMSAFSRFLRPDSRATMLTSHSYGTNSCVKDPASPVFPTVPNLLSLRASRTLLDGLGSYIALAHSRHASFRIDEMGSVTCGGPPGVSNTMATALWGVDALFAVARGGVDGVNLHSAYDRVNNLFNIRFSRGHWRGAIEPLYYGALMFARADPAGSRLLSVNGGTQGSLRVWASQNGHRQIRVTVINDSISSGVQVLVRAPVGFHSADGKIERLQASGAYATRGVTLGGRSFGVTTTGRLAPPHLQEVKSHGGRYAVTLAPASAALLTLDRSDTVGCGGTLLPPGRGGARVGPPCLPNKH